MNPAVVPKTANLTGHRVRPMDSYPSHHNFSQPFPLVSRLCKQANGHSVRAGEFHPLSKQPTQERV